MCVWCACEGMLLMSLVCVLFRGFVLGPSCFLISGNFFRRLRYSISTLSFCKTPKRFLLITLMSMTYDFLSPIFFFRRSFCFRTSFVKDHKLDFWIIENSWNLQLWNRNLYKSKQSNNVYFTKLKKKKKNLQRRHYWSWIICNIWYEIKYDSWCRYNCHVWYLIVLKNLIILF